MRLIDADKQVDEGYLADWYIHSVCGGAPEWTEEHIEELCRDFVVIPRESAVIAFDKEKVIEELENYLFEKYCVEGDGKICEIVEKGGIE